MTPIATVQTSDLWLAANIASTAARMAGSLILLDRQPSNVQTPWLNLGRKRTLPALPAPFDQLAPISSCGLMHPKLRPYNERADESS